ncbi:hypothetical protein [Shinella pollutisoli]|uniref:Uncharacterized protein n=1 Tax=Shinella pollutisoli TaxID=2250594 RepID=A0ABV7DCP1_9HYPH|nr:hypothetical protein [Shinella pollutisoli]
MLGSDDKSLGKSPKAKRTKARAMSPVAEAQMDMRLAFPPARYGKLENVYYHAVRFIAPRVDKHFTLRRARAIWEGTARRIDSEEMDALRQAKIEETRREQKELRARLAALDEMLASVDAALACPPLAGEGERVRGAGGMDRSGTP